MGYSLRLLAPSPWGIPFRGASTARVPPGAHKETLCEGLRLFASRPRTPTQRKSLRALMDLFADAVCCAAKSLKSSVEKLFGNSEWVPNRGYESGQDGSKESLSADSWHQRSALERPSAIFQTVSEGEFCELRQNGVLRSCAKNSLGIHRPLVIRQA